MLRVLASFLLAFIDALRLRRERGPARPTWSLRFEWIVRYLRRDWEATRTWDLPRLRAELHRRPYPNPVGRKTKCRDAELGGVPARWVVPPAAREERFIIFFHGGSFIYGSGRTTHAEVIARLAIASGVTVIAPDYRLAPEHPFPAQLEDAERVYAALVASGVSPKQIVLSGDSAGGNLALELALSLRDRGTPGPAGLLLVSPWSDLEMPGKSFVENDRYDYGTREVLAVHARAFAGGAALDDPRLSPVHARLDGIGPVLVIAGELEIPRDDILALAARMKDAGVDVTVHVAPDMPHNPPIFAAYHPAAAAALDVAAAFVKRALC